MMIMLLMGASRVIAADEADSSPAATIYVARRGWHIDVGLQVADLAMPLAVVAQSIPRARYVFFGFGDRHYLLARKRNAPVLLAALWPGPGLLLLTGLPATPEQGFGTEHVISLALNAAGMRALQAFIWTSLATQEAVPVWKEPGPYEDSVYMPATARYSALHTCNTWDAEALRAAGFNVHSTGLIFAGQLWAQARRLLLAQTK